MVKSVPRGSKRHPEDSHELCWALWSEKTPPRVKSSSGSALRGATPTVCVAKLKKIKFPQVKLTTDCPRTRSVNAVYLAVTTNNIQLVWRPVELWLKAESSFLFWLILSNNKNIIIKPEKYSCLSLWPSHMHPNLNINPVWTFTPSFQMPTWW